ncbi:Abi family protein [Curtobacterium sp. PhB78]|uniref:Abi family protein n=1 Tax=Curtobacterium sp. PhB78 TaxID=2485102 RepID=UPI000FC2EE31|nr:Abi family protein [Curtobacterium sp. PhB78]ROS37189.1 abortive infection bacteriophage resistance protein [Curtobacterium sp. PhB78]
MTSTYAKPFLSVEDQLELIERRGLQIGDKTTALNALASIGYYRLSGYWYPFRVPASAEDEARPSDFVAGSSLADVIASYRFDEALRAAVLLALSRVEVALRFRIGHLLGRTGPFTHTDPSALSSDWTRSRNRSCSGPNCTSACDHIESDHQSWLRKQARAEELSNETFMPHFEATYGRPLPVWAATEVMSFGTLNRLFGGMSQRHRQQIAIDFDLYLPDGNGDAAALSNWLEHLRQVRNTAAHHARLWNRNLTAPLAVPEGAPELAHLREQADEISGTTPVSRPSSRVYGTLVVLAYFLVRIDGSNETRDGLRDLIESFAGDSAEKLRGMGFPQGWEAERVWQPDYARDRVLLERAEALRGIDLLYPVDAAARLWHKESQSKQRSRLGYYRKQGAVLAVPGAQAHRYPAFQFNDETGDLFPVVINANRRLLQGGDGTEQQRWDALQWWSVQQAVLGSDSPRRALEAGSLTNALLDSLLPPLPETDLLG